MHRAAALLVGFVSLLSPIFSSIAAAEESPLPDERIEQIVVVANKDERPLREIAANVTVLSRTELDNQLATSINDVFRYVPGVEYEAAGTRFGTEGINIRGIGGNRVAILVDGVPLTDQFDTGSFSNATRDFIDAGLVQDIEVLHGPASALYGSAAIGGVVSVRTPDPVTLAGARGWGGDFLGTWRGADQSLHGQVMAALGDASLGVLAGFSWRDGEQLDSAAVDLAADTRNTNRRTALLKFVADDRRGGTWRASVIRQQAQTLSDLNSMLGSGRYRSTTALEGDDRYDLDVVNFAYEFGSPESWLDAGVLRVFWEQTDITQLTLDERAAAASPVSIDRHFSFAQEIRGAELNLWKDIGGDRLSQRLGVGFEYRLRTTEEYRDGLSTNLDTGAETNVLLGEVFPLRDFPLSETTDLAVYLEDTFRFGSWTLIGAVRVDRYELSPQADSLYAEDYPAYEPIALSETDTSPKLGLIYNIAGGLDLYAQYSRGFRAPPYADANISLDLPLFQYRAVPNPDLRSESSDGFDIGLRWHGERTTASLSAFRTDYDDFIESKVNVGTDPESGYTLFQSRNIENTRIEGLETAWSLGFGANESFSLSGSGYYARGENDATGEPLNSVGPAQSIVSLGWRSPGEAVQLRLTGTFTAAYDQLDESRGELFAAPGYGVLDAYYVQRLGANTVVRAGLHNLTDRTYWVWSDVRGLSPDDPIIPYLAQAGLSASVSLNLVW